MSNSFRNVCVVGGGPAGLASAIALKGIGCTVTLIDCAIPPIDKACGEGLMPETVAALSQLGVEIPAETGLAFRGIRFADSRSLVSADFTNGAARGVRRTVLHEILIQRAQELGVPMIWNAKHVRLEKGGLALDDRLLDADLIVGADGLNSQIRRKAGLHRIRRERRRYAFRCHYRIEPWSAYMELHWGPSSQIYITPVSREEVCIAAMSRDSRIRLEDALAFAPEIKRRLQSAVPITPKMGALSISRTFRSVYRDNVVLVGDASGSVDAITGEGMYLAFEQALALAGSVQRNDLRNYQQNHRALMRRPQAMASLMLALDSRHAFQRRALAALARHPEIFESLLSVHVGASSFLDLCPLRFFDFGRAFLAA